MEGKIWECPFCNGSNFSNATTCFYCGRIRVLEAEKIAKADVNGTCSSIVTNNHFRFNATLPEHSTSRMQQRRKTWELPTRLQLLHDAYLRLQTARISTTS